MSKGRKSHKLHGKLKRKKSVRKLSHKQERILSETFEALNEELLLETMKIVHANKRIDMRELGKIYDREVRRVMACLEEKNPDLSFSDPENSPVECVPLPSDYPPYYKNNHSNKYFTESYLLLASVHKINPLSSNENTLDALLNMKFENPNEDPALICYINVNDVIKSKGNSIMGPKREDIGKFNRKLFETYSSEIESTTRGRLLVNIKFYPEIERFVGRDTVISADPVKIFKFDGPSCARLGDFTFIVHENDIGIIFSVVCDYGVLFDRLSPDKVKAVLSKDKKKIVLLHLELFALFVVEFLGVDVATSVSRSLFGEEDPVLMSSLFDIGLI